MRFLIYFGWTILIGIIILTAATYQFLFIEKVQLNFNLIPVVISKVSLPIFAGILLRVPKLIHEIIQKKPWTFDWVKFTAIGIPAFSIPLLYLLAYTSLGDGIITELPLFYLIANPIIQIIAGIVFGYILLDSLKKQ